MKMKIGLLPMYLKLYDDRIPDMHSRIDTFLNSVSDEFEKRGLQVISSPVCRIRSEFEKSVQAFEEAGVDALVTFHLAYSPSLESSDVLAKTRLPVVVLDTTPTFEFGPLQDPWEIMFNHGIHGVQDMCNLLIRNRKPFMLEAGHWQKSDVLDRVVGCIRAVKLSESMKNARVGRIGDPFEGMGDFNVPADVLKSTIGVETVPCGTSAILELMKEVKDEEVKREMLMDRATFDTSGIDEETHRRTIKVCLAIRRWIKKEALTSFSINFTAIDKASGVPTVPFLEASKAMAAGMGYAGEGDVLTAALDGALASVFPETTFTEMFCPDWENNSVFLSHMGEMNLNLAAEQPRLLEMDFPYTGAQNPAIAYARFKAGEAVLVNLAPGPDNTYTLIVSSVEMLPVKGEDKMNNSIHGWFKPPVPVADFLKKYSLSGGTHHCVLVYGKVQGEIVKFGSLMGWKVVEI